MLKALMRPSKPDCELCSIKAESPHTNNNIVYHKACSCVQQCCVHCCRMSRICFYFCSTTNKISRMYTRCSLIAKRLIVLYAN